MSIRWEPSAIQTMAEWCEMMSVYILLLMCMPLYPITYPHFRGSHPNVVLTSSKSGLVPMWPVNPPRDRLRHVVVCKLCQSIWKFRSLSDDLAQRIAATHHNYWFNRSATGLSAWSVGGVIWQVARTGNCTVHQLLFENVRKILVSWPYDAIPLCWPVRMGCSFDKINKKNWRNMFSIKQVAHWPCDRATTAETRIDPIQRELCAQKWLDLK